MSDIDLGARIDGLDSRVGKLVTELHSVNSAREIMRCTTIKFDSSGIVSLEFASPFGAVAVLNAGGNTITVAAAGPDSAAPASGDGVLVVRATVTRYGVLNAEGRVVTLYGTSGDQATVTVYRCPQPA